MRKSANPFAPVRKTSMFEALLPAACLAAVIGMAAMSDGNVVSPSVETWEFAVNVSGQMQVWDSGLTWDDCISRMYMLKAGVGSSCERR